LYISAAFSNLEKQNSFAIEFCVFQLTSDPV